MSPRFATLTFDRQVQAPLETLWQAWTAPAARALWAAPSPEVTVEVLEAQTIVGGREITLCRAAGYPDIRAEVQWLHLTPARLAVNSELVTSPQGTDAAALVTAEFSGDDRQARLALTIQLCALADNMEAGYRHGYGAGIANLAGLAERTMVIRRVIRAPAARVWGAWWNAASLPLWWGPDGFSCRTTRIDLRDGGEWLFDMIGPDGTVWPNHHRYGRVIQGERIEYALLWGENGPKHADAWAAFEEADGATTVTLGMVFATGAAFQDAKGFGAEALGLQTLGKLARQVGAD